jgi:hypothetical protein
LVNRPAVNDGAAIVGDLLPAQIGCVVDGDPGVRVRQPDALGPVQRLALFVRDVARRPAVAGIDVQGALGVVRAGVGDQGPIPQRAIEPHVVVRVPSPVHIHT